MEVLQVAMVWICLIADPGQCETRFSEPFMAPYGTADQRTVSYTHLTLPTKA